jgi:GAF domain-containing protein
MSAFQSLTARLLFAADASRAVLHLRADDGRFAIAAEAVRHGLEQIRNVTPDAANLDRQTLDALQAGATLAEDLPEGGAGAGTAGAQARIVAPLTLDGELVGVISLHHAKGASGFATGAREALESARKQALALLRTRRGAALQTGVDDLRTAAAQAVLDRLRQGLGVQRCTYRRPVLDAYAFPVVLESREEGVRALLGDFTIVQSGQPVINKLLEGRAQVVQPDTRAASDEQIFHVMLGHYGNMRAQIVTPYIVGDELAGVLSVHDLAGTRDWTDEEQKLAAEATRLIGKIYAP